MKKLLTAALVACSMLTLVACGGEEPAAESTVAPVESTVAPVEEESKVVESEEPEVAADDATIVYWSMWNEAEPQGQTLKAASEQFMEENPHITVEINFQGRDIMKTIATKLSSNEKVDIFDSATNAILPLTKEYALDLTSYYDQVYPTTNGQPYKDVTLKSTRDIVVEYSNPEEINGVAYAPFVQCIMYNKDHFADAGITALPETWDELVVASEKLKAAGYAPMTMDDAYMVSLPGMYLARAKGGDWVAELVETNSDEMWQDPAVLEMAQAFSDYTEKGYFHENVSSNVWPAGQQDIAIGDVSMYLNATWLVGELMVTTGDEFPWGQMPFPAVEGGVGSKNDNNFASSAFVINKASDVPDEAFEFITYLTTGEWDAAYAESSYSVPAGIDSVWPTQLEDAKDIFVDIESWVAWSGGLENNGDLVPGIKASFQSLIGGKITAEEFVQEMVDM